MTWMRPNYTVVDEVQHSKGRYRLKQYHELYLDVPKGMHTILFDISTFPRGIVCRNRVERLVGREVSESLQVRTRVSQCCFRGTRNT